MKLRKAASKILAKRGEQYPKVTLVELDGCSSVFEVTNSTEEYRTAQFGGEREQLEQFLSLIAPNDVVWDVGANVGLYSIFAARKGAEVHAFEPDPGFSDHLKRNIELNGQGVSVHEFALAEENGTATLYTDGTAGNSPSLADGDEERQNVEIKMRRGEDINIPQPDVLKIDVEGAESGVVQGLGDRISDVRTIFVEVHPQMLPDFGSSVEEVRNLIENGGFRIKREHQRDDQLHIIYEKY